MRESQTDPHPEATRLNMEAIICLSEQFSEFARITVQALKAFDEKLEELRRESSGISPVPSKEITQES